MTLIDKFDDAYRLEYSSSIELIHTACRYLAISISNPASLLIAKGFISGRPVFPIR